MVEFERAEHRHAAELAPYLREQDAEELRATGATDFASEIASCISGSEWALAARSEDGLCCVFGVAALGDDRPDVGVPWMLGTALLLDQRKALMREAIGHVRRMRDRFPVLFNTVHAENSVAIRWLAAMGFEFGDPVWHPKTGAKFIPFSLQ